MVREGREVHFMARPTAETILSIDRRTAHADEGRAVVTGLSLDVIFPVLHGPYGEDGTIQGLLELRGRMIADAKPIDASDRAANETRFDDPILAHAIELQFHRDPGRDLGGRFEQQTGTRNVDEFDLRAEGHSNHPQPRTPLNDTIVGRARGSAAIVASGFLTSARTSSVDPFSSRSISARSSRSAICRATIDGSYWSPRLTGCRRRKNEKRSRFSGSASRSMSSAGIVSI